MTVTTTQALAARDAGRELKRDLSRSQRGAAARSIALILPLLVVVVVTFIVPIGTLLSRAVSDNTVRPVLPRTFAALQSWNGQNLPGDDAYSALVQDLRSLQSTPPLAQAASRLNSDEAGMRTLMMSTRAKLQNADTTNPRVALAAISPKWETIEPWAAIARSRGPLTDYYLLAAVDMRRDATGVLAQVPESSRVFVQTILRTFKIALGVTVLTLLLGFPFAYVVNGLSERWARVMMFMVLLPFWTSVLVRTLSWMVLLQKEGILNKALLGIGLIDAPLPLLFNRFAVYLALVHIFLPYMVLPLCSVMGTIPASHLRAGASLGAPPFTVFRRIFLPQVMPGIAAGSLLVFIQSLGIYVTPSILGGPDDQGISYMIAFYVNKSLNWGLAAALSLLLLVSVGIFYWLFRRLSGGATVRIA